VEHLDRGDPLANRRSLWTRFSLDGHRVHERTQYCSSHPRSIIIHCKIRGCGEVYSARRGSSPSYITVHPTSFTSRIAASGTAASADEPTSVKVPVAGTVPRLADAPVAVTISRTAAAAEKPTSVKAPVAVTVPRFVDAPVAVPIVVPVRASYFFPQPQHSCRLF